MARPMSILAMRLLFWRSYRSASTLGIGSSRLSDLARGEVEIDIDVTADQSVSPGFSIQTLLRTLAPVDLTISALELRADFGSEIHRDDRIARARSEGMVAASVDGTRGHSKKRAHISTGRRSPALSFTAPIGGCPKAAMRPYLSEPLAEDSNSPAPFTTVGAALASRGTSMAAISRGAARAALGWPILRASTEKLGAKSRPSAVHQPPLCTFQAISRETELASKHLVRRQSGVQ